MNEEGWLLHELGASPLNEGSLNGTGVERNRDNVMKRGADGWMEVWRE